MLNQEISIIKTGRGLGGSRLALIFAPPNAEAGSMVALTDFLNEQTGIRAVPGYHGPNENHVLRVSGIPGDESFMTLLNEGFPAWQKEHPIGQSIKIAENACCKPMDEVDHFPHQSAFKRFIKENANTLTGLAYMTGSLSLLLAAWKAPKSMPGHPQHDYLRTYTAGSYFAAAAILVALSQKSDNPRDVYTIMESVYPPLTRQNNEDRELAQENAHSIASFLRNHPWEVSMLLNTSGAASHALSSFKRGRNVEMVAALATLTACGLSAIIPEKNGRSLIPIGEWLEDKHGRGMMQQLEAFAESHPNAGGWIKHATAAMDWMQDNPLKLAAGVSGVANVGYAASGIIQNNPALTGMSAAYAAGNYTQSMATKGRGDGFDSVVTAAARIIAADDSLKNASSAEVQQRIENLATRLTNQREIVHGSKRMARGIRARLDRIKLDKEFEGDDVLTGFLPSEKQILMRSPFAKPGHVQRVLPSLEEMQNSQQAQIS